MTVDERQIIRDAMLRLLDGKPIRSSGALTVVGLAEEAGVKRHLLTHRHTDLRDEFYDRVRGQGRVPHSETQLRAKINHLEDALEAARSKREELQAENALLWRMNNVLAVEKAAADEALRAVTSGSVSSIFRPRRTPAASEE